MLSVFVPAEFSLKKIAATDLAEHLVVRRRLLQHAHRLTQIEQTRNFRPSKQ